MTTTTPEPDGRDSGVAAKSPARPNRRRSPQLAPRQPTSEHNQTPAARERRENLLKIVQRLPWGTDAREIGYLGVEAGLYAKGDAGAQQVENDLNLMVGWGWFSPLRISDHTRGYESPLYVEERPIEYIRSAVQNVRYDPWVGGSVLPMIWVESRTIANMLGDVPRDHGVTVYPCNGQGGSAWLAAQAEEIGNDDRTPCVLWLGDWDPDGAGLESVCRAKLTRGSGKTIAWNRIGADADDAKVLGTRESAATHWSERFADPSLDRYVPWEGPMLQGVALGRRRIQARLAAALTALADSQRDRHDAWDARTARLREIMAQRCELTAAELRYIETGER